jgi:hypothetical protein
MHVVASNTSYADPPGFAIHQLTSSSERQLKVSRDLAGLACIYSGDTVHRYSSHRASGCLLSVPVRSSLWRRASALPLRRFSGRFARCTGLLGHLLRGESRPRFSNVALYNTDPRNTHQAPPMAKARILAQLAEEQGNGLLHPLVFPSVVQSGERDVSLHKRERPVRTC